MYQLTTTENVIRLDDGAIIPADPANCAYTEFLAWLNDGNTPLPAPPLPPEPVPASVTARQIRLFLYRQGLLPQVETLVNAANGAVRIEWEYGIEYHRQSAILLDFAQTMGLTSAQLDDWFRAAAKL